MKMRSWPRPLLPAVVIAVVVFLSGNQLQVVDGCLRILFRSESLGADLDFVQIPLNANISDSFPKSGRPAYQAVLTNAVTSENQTYYLYHEMVSFNGIGRWIVNDILGEVDKATMYVTSWAVAPHLVADSSDAAYWMANTNEGWLRDESVSVECVDHDDGVIFFDTMRYSKHLTSYYVRRRQDDSNSVASTSVFTQIKFFDNDQQLYLYRFEDKWMIGDVPNVDSCQSFTASDTADVQQIGNEWNYLDDSNNTAEVPTWTEGEGVIVTRSLVEPDEEGRESTRTFSSIVQALRYRRSLKFLPNGQLYVTLRNDVPMPRLGFGTGGLQHGEQTQEAIETALRRGYRMLDMARAYENEHELPGILKKLQEDPNEENVELPGRADVFIVTKVWPTHLGFSPTMESIEASLLALDTDYVDLYLIHWPRYPYYCLDPTNIILYSFVSCWSSAATRTLIGCTVKRWWTKRALGWTHGTPWKRPMPKDTSMPLGLATLTTVC
jgi:hypothetical protein